MDIFQKLTKQVIFAHIFLRFLGNHSSAAPEKKRKNNLFSETNFLYFLGTVPPAAQLATEDARALAVDFGVWGMEIREKVFPR